jgi:hypothetical protein
MAVSGRALNPAVQIDRRKIMNPLTICLYLCRTQRLNDRSAEKFFSIKKFQRLRNSDSSAPTMGKQSQIIIFWVISERPDVGLCLRLFGVKGLPLRV